MNKTKIEWADSTWNPVTGCNHGCEYCYARRIAERFGGASETHHNEAVWNECQWETGATGELHILDAPIYDNDRGHNAPYPYYFDPTFYRYRLGEYEKKAGRTIFVCSMADLFGSWVPDGWIEEVFAACERAPQHRYLFLKKNPQRYIDFATAGKLPAKDNMWYGTTATTPDEQFFYGGAWHTFVSIEPILRDYSGEIGEMCDTFAQWVIIGAETGNRAGKVVPEQGWVKEITKTCIEKNIPLLMKESLTPIIGEENMFRELPWDRGTWETEHGQKWLDKYYEEESRNDV